MAKIVISDLHPIDANNFLHDLTSVKMDAVLGSSLDSSATLLLSTIFDGVIKLASDDGLPNTSNNKLFEVDFSNLAVNFIVI
ncbi:hypothetical protein [Nostoc sp. MG11]|uniref:hypothetical protein n=1 Tax=Nostoc sp. MG11 TaxID=2721166 RepID=UPI0018674A09|nr:hypothetical protein [Nostoc sp. MG11]